MASGDDAHEHQQDNDDERKDEDVLADGSPSERGAVKFFNVSPLCLIFEGQPTNPWNHPGLAFNFLPKYIQLHSCCSLSLRVHYLNQDKDQHQGSRIRIMFNTSASTLSLFFIKTFTFEAA